MKKTHAPLDERFWRMVKIPTDPYDCWLWLGALRNGYGVIGEGTRQGKTLYAHRLSYENHREFIPENEEICHSCNNRKCVNPLHLYSGSRSDNMQQCVSQGRHKGSKGKHWKLIREKRVYS